jgi:hypothetical protein
MSNPGVPVAPAPINREARHTTQCKRYDNNCGAVHPSNCPDCQFRTAGVEASRKPQEWTDPEKEPRFQPGEET